MSVILHHTYIGVGNNTTTSLYSKTAREEEQGVMGVCDCHPRRSDNRRITNILWKTTISPSSSSSWSYYNYIVTTLIILSFTMTTKNNPIFVEAAGNNRNNDFQKSAFQTQDADAYHDPLNLSSSTLSSSSSSSSTLDLSAYPNNYYPTGPFYHDRLPVTPPIRSSSSNQRLSPTSRDDQQQQTLEGRATRGGKRKGKRGKFSIDIQGNRQRLLSRVKRLDVTQQNHYQNTDASSSSSTTTRTKNSNDHDRNNKKSQSTPNDASSSSSSSLQTELSLSIDPISLFRLARVSWEVMASFGVAFMGTLRLLAPIIVARRAINSAGDLAMDYATGRYIRKTYTRMEQLYLNYYEMPAAFRSFCRVNSQLGILLILSKIMSWLVGIDHAPCKVVASSSTSSSSSVANWCGLLWIGAVVGTGHAFSTAVAVWGGPLRVQVAAEHLHTGRVRVFTRPWHIFQWLEDPEAWISMISSPLPQQPPPQLKGGRPQQQPRFDPNPILFPATWVPLRLFQLVAVGLIISNCPGTWKSRKNPIITIMKQFLVHLTLSDEWYRVFFGEKRVGLGCFVAFSYFIATTSLVITARNVNGISALLLLPSLIAVIISGYMNLIIFWKRLEDRHRKYAIDIFNERKDAALKALKL